jgi:hypothetical protein
MEVTIPSAFRISTMSPNAYRLKGASRSAGRSHAIAFACTCCSGGKVSGRHSFRLSAGQEITPPVEHDLLATAQAPLRFSERHTFVRPQDHPRPVSKTPFCFPLLTSAFNSRRSLLLSSIMCL